MIIATAGGFFRHLDADKWVDIGKATLETLLMMAGSLPLPWPSACRWACCCTCSARRR